MSTSTRPEQTVDEAVECAIQTERRRCVGLVLTQLGVCRLASNENAARILDRLATVMEHPEVLE